MATAVAHINQSTHAVKKQEKDKITTTKKHKETVMIWNRIYTLYNFSGCWSQITLHTSIFALAVLLIHNHKPHYPIHSNVIIIAPHFAVLFDTFTDRSKCGRHSHRSTPFRCWCALAAVANVRIMRVCTLFALNLIISLGKQWQCLRKKHGLIEELEYIRTFIITPISSKCHCCCLQ